MTVLAVWLVFSERCILARCIVFALGVLGVWFYSGAPMRFFEVLGVLIDARIERGIALQAFLIVIVLLIIRLRGYRLVKVAHDKRNAVP
jgi:hypothetical protein